MPGTDDGKVAPTFNRDQRRFLGNHREPSAAEPQPKISGNHRGHREHREEGRRPSFYPVERTGKQNVFLCGLCVLSWFFSYL